MAVELDHMDEGAGPGAARLLVRAAQAAARAKNLLAGSIADFFLPDEARLDERTRAAVAGLFAGIVDGIEWTLAGQAARLLAERHEAALADALAKPAATAASLLLASGLGLDTDLMGELLDRVRLEALANALPMLASEGEAPTLLARLTARDDRDVADAAGALLAADNRRRTALGSNDLSAELHHRLVWWVAAILRDRHAGVADSALERALADAAAFALARNAEGDGVEVAAMYLAAALDAQGGELAALLEQAIGDRRLGLFVALIGYGCGLPFETIRGFVLDPAGDRLWVALRAIGMPHDIIARIAVALAEADSRRDLEAFADTLYDIAALDPEAARASFASLRAPADYRAALDALRRR